MNEELKKLSIENQNKIDKRNAQIHIELENMKGSWAGAMGQNQFMPSSFLNYAQDFNNDGKKNIWTDIEDSLASIARYLNGVGSNKWDHNFTWGREVLPPNNIKSIEPELFIKREKGCLAIKKLSKRIPLKEFRSYGFKKMDGGNLSNLNLLSLPKDLSTIKPTSRRKKIFLSSILPLIKIKDYLLKT